jgi:hypothetical protein
MTQLDSKLPVRKKVTRKLWRGIIEFEDEDVPADRRAFNAFGKSVVLWFEHSKELYRSAHYLMEERPRVWNEITHLLQAPIALMLGAYALETLLKMVIVDEYCLIHGVTFESTSAKEFLPTVHDLRELATRANLRINDADRKLLTELTRYSTWAGRYPIPRHYAGYSGPALKEAVPPPPASVSHQHPTWPKFVALYVKVHRLAVRKSLKRHGIILKPKVRTVARGLRRHGAAST